MHVDECVPPLVCGGRDGDRHCCLVLFVFRKSQKGQENVGGGLVWLVAGGVGVCVR